ncbi:MAG: hypothetical protein N3G21_12090 [Candidatus Hydrogenedentes bacterium]|nr:hypothetical protein [Candidatus Hydrogenedentota bacterium]
MDFNAILKEIIEKVVEYLVGLITKIVSDFFTALTGKEPVD